MKDQLFADYETSKMLKELGFDLEVTDTSKAYDKNGNDVNWTTKQFFCWKPLWQQVKAWLWENRKAWISIQRQRAKDEIGYYYIIHLEKDTAITDEEKIKPSPVIAEIEGIKKAVKYLHEQLKHKK